MSRVSRTTAPSASSSASGTQIADARPPERRPRGSGEARVVGRERDPGDRDADDDVDPLPRRETSLAGTVPCLLEPAARQRPPGEVGDCERDDPHGDAPDHRPDDADRAEQPEEERGRAEHERPGPARLEPEELVGQGRRGGRDHEQLEDRPAEALHDVDRGRQVRAPRSRAARASAPSTARAPARRSPPRSRASGSRRGSPRGSRRARRGGTAPARGSPPRRPPAATRRGCPRAGRGRARRGRAAARAPARSPRRCRARSRLPRVSPCLTHGIGAVRRTVSALAMASCLAPGHVPVGHGFVPGTWTCPGRPWLRAWHEGRRLRPRCTCRGRGRARGRRCRARRAGRRRRRACACRPRPPRGARTRASRARRRAAVHRSRRPAVAIPCHIPIGGTPRAKCSASQSCPAASSEIAQPPASRRSSWSAAWREIEKPTSGGSSESATSEPTVSPSRWPPASTVTTATPAGKRPRSARSSSESAIAGSCQARGLTRRGLSRRRAVRNPAGSRRAAGKVCEAMSVTGVPGDRPLATRPGACAARTAGCRRAARTRARAGCRAAGSRGTRDRRPSR